MTNATATQMTASAIDERTDGNRKEAADPLQLVSFNVGEEEFAIEILAVQEIVRMMEITDVPHTPSSVEGVVNLRGQITPVIDLRKRFGMSANERSQDSRIIVVEIQGRALGFIVDNVNEVMRVNASVVEPAPAMTTTVRSEYVRGVGKLDDRLLILLDLDRLFDADDLDHAQLPAEQSACGE